MQRISPTRWRRCCVRWPVSREGAARCSGLVSAFRAGSKLQNFPTRPHSAGGQIRCHSETLRSGARQGRIESGLVLRNNRNIIWTVWKPGFEVKDELEFQRLAIFLMIECKYSFAAFVIAGHVDPLAVT